MTISTAMLLHDILAIDEKKIMNGSKRFNIFMRQIDHQQDHRNMQPTFRAKPRCSRNGWANEH